MKICVGIPQHHVQRNNQRHQEKSARHNCHRIDAVAVFDGVQKTCPKTPQSGVLSASEKKLTRSVKKIGT